MLCMSVPAITRLSFSKVSEHLSWATAGHGLPLCHLTCLGLPCTLPTLGCNLAPPSEEQLYSLDMYGGLLSSHPVGGAADTHSKPKKKKKKENLCWGQCRAEVGGEVGREELLHWREFIQRGSRGNGTEQTTAGEVYLGTCIEQKPQEQGPGQVCSQCEEPPRQKHPF